MIPYVLILVRDIIIKMQTVVGLINTVIPVVHVVVVEERVILPVLLDGVVVLVEIQILQIHTLVGLVHTRIAVVVPQARTAGVTVDVHQVQHQHVQQEPLRRLLPPLPHFIPLV